MPPGEKIPAAVLAKAKAIAVEAVAKPALPTPPRVAVARPRLKREKVIAALRRLHPMD